MKKLIVLLLFASCCTHVKSPFTGEYTAGAPAEVFGAELNQCGTEGGLICCSYIRIDESSSLACVYILCKNSYNGPWSIERGMCYNLPRQPSKDKNI